MNSIATQTLKQILAATKKAGKNILQAGKKKNRFMPSSDEFSFRFRFALNNYLV